jgi:hypothetical protein
MDLLENNQKFESNWNPSKPWQTVMTCINQCCNYANNAICPCSEAQRLSEAHALVLKTSLYFDALDKWEEAPLAIKRTISSVPRHRIVHMIKRQQNNLELSKCKN